MAQRPVAIRLFWPGALAIALVLILTFGTLSAVAWRAEWSGGLSFADWFAIRFTVLQALASAILSVGLAIPVARVLARRRFRGRKLVITLLGAPFLLPVIVAVFGLLAVFGREGLLNNLLEVAGLPSVSIFGFHGVVLAHVFLNLPLAIRLLLQGWLAIPAERFRLAATLHAPIWRLLEWPMLRAIAPGVFLVVFVICLTSFAVALTLGGGPRATTIELAIYQALRFDFDLGRAALLACLQFSLCVFAALLAWRVSRQDGFGVGKDRTVQRWDLGKPFVDYGVIALASAFLILPLLMVVLRGLPGLTELPHSVWPAVLRSVGVASCSAVLCISLSLSLALLGGRVAATVGVLPLAASGLVIGTGTFLMVYPIMNPTKVALVVTILVNSTLALPFALRAILPAVAQVQQDFGRLSQSMGLSRWAFLRLIVLPRIRRPLGFGAGLAAAMSMGDLGVIALFAGQEQETLPLAMYRLMGAYRIDAAAGAALLLLALSLLLFWICDQGGRADADL